MVIDFNIFFSLKIYIIFILINYKSSKNILVGVTSGIAIYKSLDLVSMLVKAGYEVNVVMTENATKLINPLIF